MFGSKKIQELEAQVSELQSKLSQETAQKNDLAQQLESARQQIAEMESQLHDFDLEQAKESARASRAEYEGLKDLYTRKNREFEDAREDAEQSFAREEALKRHNLENEIRDNRQANQDYVTSTVKSFGESYNYYLNQIKLLMDALGDVATRTGEALFAGENADLKSRFGSQMRDTLKSGTDGLKGDTGDLILIGSAEVEEKAEALPDDVEETAEEAAEELTDVAEAAEEAAQELTEKAEDGFESLIEEVKGE